MKILFVCLGNICRSSSAEEVMRTFVKREGLQEKIEIDVETVVKKETIPTPEPSVEDEKEIEIKSEPIPTKKNSNISIDFFMQKA